MYTFKTERHIGDTVKLRRILTTSRCEQARYYRPTKCLKSPRGLEQKSSLREA
jgi:hypothetical protein